jgi:hypothetical protein
MLISIGKFFIDKTTKYKIHMDEFVQAALSYIDNEKNPSKIEDLIEVKSYINILKNFDSLKKRVIIKDFTASFFQHMTRLLGASSQETLELANMFND